MKSLAILFAVVLLCAVGTMAQTQTGVYKTQGGNELVVGTSGSIQCTAEDGAVATNGVTVVDYGDCVSHRTTFTFSGLSLGVKDSGANGGHDGIQLYDFPVGYISIEGVIVDVDILCNSTGLTDTATYEIGLGTTEVAVDNAALTSTEEDVVAGSAADLSDNAKALTLVATTDANLDGTTTAKDLFFNTAWAADDCSASDTCTLTGTVTVTWFNLGDY